MCIFEKNKSMRKYLLILLLINISFVFAKKSKNEITYPISKKIAHTDTYFGTKIEDPYQWLENDTSAETAAWVAAQNKVTFDYLSKIPYREDLRKRYSELYDFAKLYDPIVFGDHFYFSKKYGLQNQPVIYEQKTVNGTPTILLNPNTYDPSGLTAVSINSISTDGRYIVFSFHVAGSDWGYIRIFDLQQRVFLNEKIEWVKSTGTSWYKDGFFYSRYDQPNGSALSDKNEYLSVYYHKLGDVQGKDEFVYKDNTNPNISCYVNVSENQQYQFLYKYNGTYGFEVYWKKSSEEGWNFKPLFTGFDNENSVVETINDKLIVLTDYNAPNKRLVQVDPNFPDPKNWKDIIPEQKTNLETVTVSGYRIIAQYLENANNKLYVFDLDGKNKKEITLPGQGTISISGGRMSDNLVLYSYTSFNYPTSIFLYNTLTGYSELFLKPNLKFNTDDYVTEQVWYKSKDGKKISMFIVHKKGIKLDKNNPTYLYGYGGFSISMTPYFSPSMIILLENGGVYAMPNLRGGGEYGEAWHQDGMKMKKQNVFNDFIAAAQYLIKKKYTTKDKLAIAGGSNGGLLVGAVMTQKPNLFKVAFPAVGVLDMLKYQKFTIGHAWAVEFGSSEQSKEMFDYLKSYSPYHNIKKNVKYPATLITTADHDDRVVPAHSFKFAARLQEYANKSNPELIRIGINAGHGAGKPTSKIMDEVSDQWSFFFWNMGYKQLPSFKK